MGQRDGGGGDRSFIFVFEHPWLVSEVGKLVHLGPWGCSMSGSLMREGGARTGKEKKSRGVVEKRMGKRGGRERVHLIWVSGSTVKRERSGKNIGSDEGGGGEAGGIGPLRGAALPELLPLSGDTTTRRLPERGGIPCCSVVFLTVVFLRS